MVSVFAHFVTHCKLFRLNWWSLLFYLVSFRMWIYLNGLRSNAIDSHWRIWPRYIYFSHSSVTAFKMDTGSINKVQLEQILIFLSLTGMIHQKLWVSINYSTFSLPSHSDIGQIYSTHQCVCLLQIWHSGCIFEMQWIGFYFYFAVYMFMLSKIWKCVLCFLLILLNTLVHNTSKTGSGIKTVD